MLNPLKELLGHSIHASDGPIGVLEDVYFDDARWVMRYLVVDIGRFIHKRKVLLSTESIDDIDGTLKTVSINHTREEIKHSPDIDICKPVYRQAEEQLANYYGWVVHWIPQHDLPEPSPDPMPTGDLHLRSMNNVCSYTLMAFDGRVGQISDFLVDHDGWHLPLAILDTSHYLPVGPVVIPSEHIKGIRVEDREISLALNKDEVAHFPHFDPTHPLEEYLAVHA